MRPVTAKIDHIRRVQIYARKITKLLLVAYKKKVRLNPLGGSHECRRPVNLRRKFD